MMKYVWIVIIQKLIGIGLIGLTIVAALKVDCGIGISIFTLPLSLPLIIANVPFIECEGTYEFWKNQK